MTNSNKLLNIRNILIVVGILVLTIGAYFLGMNDPKESSSGTKQVIKFDDNKTQPQTNSEADCSSQAAKFTKDYRDQHDEVEVNATNHFNKILQKCVVNLITTNTAINVFGNQVVDAYESKVLVGCNYGGPIKKEVCFIPSDSSETGQPVPLTKENAEAMIHTYMNN